MDHLTPEELTKSLKAEAKRLGFAFTGACPAVSPEGFHRFLEWLERGYAGEMSYLESRKEAYRHPDGVMEGTKSILMLALNYDSTPRGPDRPGTGKIARYAWGHVDYHDLIHKKLKQLKSFAAGLSEDMTVRGVVDTAPLLEREFAQLAGLGWIGKNALLLNKQNGSYFFLAALLINQTLEYDSPTGSSHCGTCTACLDACPTKAFVQPYVLDASKCISYLTIEHRGPISDDLKPKMDGWILGCDVCQDVCPWNRMATGPQERELEKNPVYEPIELGRLFSMDDDAFRKEFRKTPMWRPRRRGILRNAALAMADQPVAENVVTLVNGTRDLEPTVRGACLWALSRHLEVADVDAIRLAIEELLKVETETENIDAARQLVSLLKEKSQSNEGE